MTAERRVDPGLAHQRPVETEALPRLTRDRVGQDSVRRARHRVHANEERGVAAGFEKRRVLGPLLLDDVLAGGIEKLGEERVEVVRTAGAMAVHDDDLGRARGLGAAHGCVDLLGVEDATFVVELLAAGGLLPLDDAGDAFHVADHVDSHGPYFNREAPADDSQLAQGFGRSRIPRWSSRAFATAGRGSLPPGTTRPRPIEPWPDVADRR